MTTSGSSDFNLDMAEVAEEAFERCGLELRTGYDAKTARRSLNLLFAEWAEITQSLAYLSSSSSVATYPIGTITMTVAASANFTVGETITGGTSGATASIITKPTATSMTITIPVGTFSATETLTGSSSGATTTLSSAVSLADAQSTVDVLEVAIRRSGADTVTTRLSRGDYLAISDKDSQGRPTQFYIDRQITPTMTVWPSPENSTDQLIYYRVRRTRR